MGQQFPCRLLLLDRSLDHRFPAPLQRDQRRLHLNGSCIRAFFVCQRSDVTDLTCRKRLVSATCFLQRYNFIFVICSTIGALVCDTGHTLLHCLILLGNFIFTIAFLHIDNVPVSAVYFRPGNLQPFFADKRTLRHDRERLEACFDRCVAGDRDCILFRERVLSDVPGCKLAARFRFSCHCQNSSLQHLATRFYNCSCLILHGQTSICVCIYRHHILRHNPYGQFYILAYIGDSDLAASILLHAGFQQVDAGSLIAVD